MFVLTLVNTTSSTLLLRVRPVSIWLMSSSMSKAPSSFLPLTSRHTKRTGLPYATLAAAILVPRVSLMASAWLLLIFPTFPTAQRISRFLVFLIFLSLKWQVPVLKARATPPPLVFFLPSLFLYRNLTPVACSMSPSSYLSCIPPLNHVSVMAANESSNSLIMSISEFIFWQSERALVKISRMHWSFWKQSALFIFAESKSHSSFHGQCYR